jgi:hypothetical protein
MVPVPVCHIPTPRGLGVQEAAIPYAARGVRDCCLLDAEAARGRDVTNGDRNHFIPLAHEVTIPRFRHWEKRYSSAQNDRVLRPDTSKRDTRLGSSSEDCSHLRCTR